MIGTLGAALALREPDPETDASTHRPPALPVAVVEAKPSEHLKTSRTVSGEVVAARSGALAFERPGMLVRLLVDEGVAVDKGQLLAELDSRTLRARRRELEAGVRESAATLAELEAGPRTERIDAARARVRALEAELAQIVRDADRSSRLVRDRVASEVRLERDRSTREALEARREAAKSQLRELVAGTRNERIDAQRARVVGLRAQLESIDIEIDKTRLRAPYPGSITKRGLDEGAIVASGAPIFELVETGAMEARIGVPVAEARTLDRDVEHSLWIGGQRIRARIDRIVPIVDRATRTMSVIFRLPSENPSGTVHAGEIARLEIPLERKQSGYWLPMTALTRGNKGLWACFVVVAADAASTVERRDLELLHRESDRVYVRGMLEAGDSVVATGTQRLAVGQAVRIHN